MPSVEELLSVAEVDLTGTASAIDSRIEIDADTRIIQMMPQDELFGVESDEKSERKYFKVPKIVGNGIDLSKLQIRINYQNASKMPSGKDMYIVKDATVYNDEWVYFSWELSRKVTLYKGSIYFIVCAVKADSKGNITNEWNTTLAEGKVLEGLEVETSQEQQYQASDYLEQLKQQLLDYSKEIKDTFPSDYTETVENVKNLQSDVEKLNDNKITKFYTNNNGDTVLNDSDDGKIQDLMIYGKSEQKQYKGTNLAINHLATAFVTVHGITFTVNEDKSVTLNGTSDMDNIDYYIVGTYTGNIIATLDVDKDYTIRAMPQNIILACGQQNNTKVINQANKHTKGFPIAFIYIRIEKSGTTFNNVTIYPQINEGTTLLDYEPYTGGKPSPSPEYPQEIKVVVNPVIKTHGVNILDIKDVAEKVDNNSGLTYSVQKGTLKVKGTSKQTTNIGISFLHGGNEKKLVANNTYIFNPNPTKKAETSACYLDFSNNVNLGMSMPSNSSDKPISLQKHQALYKFTLMVKFQKDTQVDMEWKPQLLLSNTLLPYQPYQETQAKLPYELYAIPVSSGGNVTIDGQQYIADYVDIERGKLVRMVEKKKVSEFEWRKPSGSIAPNVTTIITSIDNKKYLMSENNIKGKLMCSFLQVLPLYINNSYGIDVAGTNKSIGFRSVPEKRIEIRYDEYMNTVDDFKEKFKNENIFLALLLPVEIDLTPEEITAFKALSTYYPKTYINAESEQLEAYTMFNYPVSMEKGWEYVKQQIGDTRKYVYDMDAKLAETEASTLEAKIDTAILSEMVGG